MKGIEVYPFFPIDLQNLNHKIQKFLKISILSQIAPNIIVKDSYWINCWA